MFKKNKILIISIIAIIILASFLFYQKTKEKKLLNTYHNKTYNYSFRYPNYLKQKAHCSGNDNPVFVEEYPQDFYFNGVSVVTSPQNFATLDQWLEKENEYLQKFNQKRVVEKRIKIDGNKALITYLETIGSIPNLDNQSQVEVDKSVGKKTVFIKNNVLFEINTRFINDTGEQEDIWDSFKIGNFNKKFADIYSHDNLYVNDTYHYFFNYPEGIIISDYCSGYPDFVYFEDIRTEGYGLMSILVSENTEFKTIKQWQEAENAKSDDYYQKFERNILIDNYPAQVFYSYSKDEDISYDKRTVFIKDNNLFIIYTRGDELSVHQKIWDNFKFIENNIIQVEN